MQKLLIINLCIELSGRISVQKLLLMNFYIELLGRISVQKLLLLMNLHIELSGRIFGAEIIDDQLVHRAVGADFGAMSLYIAF